MTIMTYLESVLVVGHPLKSCPDFRRDKRFPLSRLYSPRLLGPHLRPGLKGHCCLRRVSPTDVRACVFVRSSGRLLH